MLTLEDSLKRDPMRIGMNNHEWVTFANERGENKGRTREAEESTNVTMLPPRIGSRRRRKRHVAL